MFKEGSKFRLYPLRSKTTSEGWSEIRNEVSKAVPYFVSSLMEKLTNASIPILLIIDNSSWPEFSIASSTFVADSKLMKLESNIASWLK